MAAGRKRGSGGKRRPELGAGSAASSQMVFLGLRDWRAGHPRATLREIEEELDRRLNAFRAQLLADLALASPAAVLGAAERLPCPECGGPVLSAGSRPRTVRTLGNEAVTLPRDYATCPARGSGFSPLDGELDLLPRQGYTPRVEELLVRLGATLPFGEAAEVLELALGLRVSEATTRRHTYVAGEAGLAVEAAELERVKREAPVAAAPPDRLQVSIDATKVPLVGGEWTDAKLAVFGDLVPGHDGEGQPILEAVNLSYAARWEPAAAFGQTITGEANRRGVDEAKLVVSPNDGAEWIQGNLDLVAPRAVRILDESHAAEHLGTIARLVFGAGTAEAAAWTDQQRRRLLTEPPDAVLTELTRCLMRGPRPGTPVGEDGLDPTQVLAEGA